MRALATHEFAGYNTQIKVVIPSHVRALATSKEIGAEIGSEVVIPSHVRALATRDCRVR